MVGAPGKGRYEGILIRTLEWLSTVRGRIGYLVTPAMLLYFTGGAAWAGASYAGGDAAPVGGGYATAVSFYQPQFGYVLGGGVEFATWDRWLLRGEYLFHRFSDVSAISQRMANSFGKRLAEGHS